MKTISELKKDISKNPMDHNSRMALATALIKQTSYQEALQHFILLLKLPQSENQTDIILGAQNCLLFMGKPDEAQKLAQDPQNFLRHFQGIDHDDNEKLEDLTKNDTSDEKQESDKNEKVRHLRALPNAGAPIEKDNLVPLSTVNKKVHFEDIVGMGDVKKTVRLKIIEPFVNPKLFARFQKTSGGGILLYGPPGCGKTMFAKAIASECQSEFISVDISDVLSMWVGQSEGNLAAIFDKARANTPCVLFFDEMDALAHARSKSNSDHSRTLVNELLNQMDGLGKDNRQILILGATNMPWDVDSAAKRPGRFSRQIFIPPLDEPARAELFRKKLEALPCEDLDFEALAAQTAFCSGADLDGIIDEAKEAVLYHIIEHQNERKLETTDIMNVIDNYSPTCVDWLKTAKNLVKFGGGDRSYREVEKYLKKTNFK